ncbi:WXG100 family type VII secretion target [Nocardia sp. NPDC050697]|uniref:WXG100 family type VII secretion target n=1 Tax=Nocardia sp. NPDC050697 TaxID=3155158 RepID=UPI0033D5E347
MGSEFSVDLDQLDQVVSRLNGLSGFLRDHLNELDKQVQALQAGGAWESAAASAYADAHRAWRTAAGEFLDGVAVMRTAAEQAHGRYSRAVDVNLRMLRSGQP